MQRTKIATVMYTIAQLHEQLASKYSLLSGIMGEGIEELDLPTIPAAAAPVVAAPVSPVIAPNVQATVSEVATTTQQVVSPTVTTTPTANAAVEVDDEGTPWDVRIHSAKKTQVKSLVVTGGKAWRMKKGCTPELVESVKAELKAAQSADNSPASPVSPAVASPVVAAPVSPVVAAPVSPVAAAPVVAAPVSPVIDYTAIKRNAIAIINRIVKDYGVNYDDVIAILVDEFKVANFEGLVDEQYQPVHDRMVKFETDYKAVNDMVLQIRAWGGELYKADVEASLLGLFKAVNAEALNGVFHSDLPAITTTITAYYQSWEASPAKQA